MISEALQFSLTALFVLAAVTSVAAIVGTWASVRDTVFALRGELTRSESSLSYRYRITSFETRVVAAKVTRLPVRTRPGLTQSGLSWPEMPLRAAA